MSDSLQALTNRKRLDLDRETRELLGQIAGLRDDLDEVEEWAKSSPRTWHPSGGVESRVGAVLNNIRDVMQLARLVQELEKIEES